MKFQEMTSGQLAGVDRENTMVMLPIAAVEQHGPHLPTGTMKDTKDPARSSAPTKKNNHRRDFLATTANRHLDYKLEYHATL